MFGYVLPDCEKLSVRDYTLYRSLYCGICMATKARYGNLPRFTVNYDITTFALLALEAEEPKLEFGMCRCIGDPRKKPYVKVCAFTERMADLNILLCAHKAKDDLIDSGKKTSLAMRLLKKPYEKAKAALPEIDAVTERRYAALREAETAGETSLDRACDHFASLLADTFALMCLGGRDECYSAAMRKLCYNVGKFVYLADALDDLDEDYKAKRYNPVLAFAPGYMGDRREYFAEHGDALRFAVSSTINRAIESSNALVFTQANDLVRNIVYEGMRKKAEELFSSERKLGSPRVYIPKRTAKEFRKAMKAEKKGK